MKGHMEDGKFHPHTQYKKGVRKSRDQTAKTQGVRMKRKPMLSYLMSGEVNKYGKTSEFYPDIPLEIDFDSKAKLEYKERPRGAWHEIDPYTFRSWGGQRRINGKNFYGNVYYLGSNVISRPAGVSHKQHIKELSGERKAREKKDLDTIIDEEVERRVENLSEDEYDDYLDEFGTSELFSNYSYSDLLKSSDEIAYRTGYNDWLDSEIRDMEREIEKEAEERLRDKLDEEADELIKERSIKEENKEDWIDEKIDERLDDEIENVREEKEEELDEDAYDEYLDNLGDDVGIGNLNIGSPAKVLEDVDPTAYRVGFSDWADGERERIEDEVRDEIDEDESIKSGEFIEQ